MLDTAIQAALAAGEILKEGFGKLTQGQIGLKGQGDYVTDLDRRSEAEILALLKGAYPHHAFCAEESGGQMDADTVTWVVDPLDGTANYVHGVPVFAVSIGAVRGDEFLVGVVYNPMTGELYQGEAGGGAWREDRRLSVRANTDPGKALLATGFPWRAKHLLSDYLEVFGSMLKASVGVRRLGAAAVDMAYVAAGIFDGFWEMSLSAWDLAAGALLVKEAGGVVTDFHGGQDFLRLGHVVAATPALHPMLLETTRAHLGPVVNR